MLQLEVFPQDQQLQQDQQQAEGDGELPQRQGEVQAQHVGDRRDRGRAQICLGDQAHAQGADEQSHQKYQIPFCFFHLLYPFLSARL